MVLNIFFVDQIESCDDSILEDREKYWIEFYDSRNSGYNATFGGDGKLLFDHDEILNELILCPYSSIVADKMGCSIDTVRSVAKQHNIRLYNIQKEKIASEYHTPKPIAAFKDDFSIYFDTISDAAKWLYESGITNSQCRSVRTHISDCAKGRNRTAYGFFWTFMS